MNERIIHRPNEFSPEEWDKLTREEQIQWFEQRAAGKPGFIPPYPLRAVELYQAGKITTSDMAFRVFEGLTQDNAEEFFAGCTFGTLNDLRQEIERAQIPGDIDEHGWSRFVVARMVCWAWPTEDDIRRDREQREELRRRIREGVRLVRAYLEDRHAL